MEFENALSVYDCHHQSYCSYCCWQQYLILHSHNNNFTLTARSDAAKRFLEIPILDLYITLSRGVKTSWGLHITLLEIFSLHEKIILSRLQQSLLFHPILFQPISVHTSSFLYTLFISTQFIFFSFNSYSTYTSFYHVVMFSDFVTFN